MQNDVVLFELVAKQRKSRLCCPDYHLMSEVSGLRLSVFVTSDQRMFWFTFICFVCLC